MVLIYHHAVVIPGRSSLGILAQIGWAGVDLFFVLSGYLIGNQILGTFALGAFFGRRLLRTLPNYYVILAVYFLFPAQLAGSSTAPAWRFLTFTQNFGLHYGQTFTHSWSLCIEEQFYLVLPLVAIAMLKNFHGQIYARLLRYGNLLLVLGLVGVVALLHFFNRDASAAGFFITTFGFPLLAGCFALLMLAGLSRESLLNRLRVPGAGSLALWSYAIYLAHKPIYAMMRMP